MSIKRKIMVVDDEEIILSLLCRTLQKSYDVTGASNGGEAISLLEKNSFDIVLTDVRMPGIGGIQLLEIVKGTTPECEVILMTGFSDIDIVIKALNQGAFAFVTKPLDTVMVFKKIEDGLAIVRSRENKKKVIKEIKNELLMQTLFAQRLSALAAMSGGIAHELSQPLNGIGIYAATLVSMADSNQKISSISVKEIAEEITEAIKKANKIIEHMREFSEETDVHDNCTLQLKKAVERSLDLFSVQLNSKNIELLIEIPEAFKILANQNRLEQIIINLVSNAKDSIVEKSKLCGGEEPLKKIVISASQCRDSIFLDIRDTGMGVPEDIQNNIFEPFVTGKKIIKGSGLGLAICRRILSDFHSKIALLESGPDGTVIRITFPKIK